MLFWGACRRDEIKHVRMILSGISAQMKSMEGVPLWFRELPSMTRPGRQYTCGLCMVP